ARERTTSTSSISNVDNSPILFVFFSNATPPPEIYTLSLHDALPIFPKDRRGRSFAQLDLVSRLMRYPCSYIVYSAAFDGLPSSVKRAVYARMLEILSGRDSRTAYAHLTSDDRRAVLEILRDTKPDFPPS